jgi:hypothetical protein
MMVMVVVVTTNLVVMVALMLPTVTPSITPTSPRAAEQSNATVMPRLRLFAGSRACLNQSTMLWPC